MSRLEGKVAIITGAGRKKGLGEGIARRFAEEGAVVVITDIGKPGGDHLPADHIGTSEEMEQVAGAIRKDTGATIDTMVCDVRSEDDITRCIADTVAKYGKLDIVVNNAGIGFIMKPLTEMSIDEWDIVLDVNLRGPFLFTKHAAKQFIAQGGGGRIINIASQAAKSGFGNTAAYTSSKHGLVGLTRVAGIELAPHKITVNAICPNHVTTGLGAWQNDFMSKAQGKSEEQYLADMRGRIPMGRVGLVDDIAKACAFLCSDQADYITAEALNVSGGEEYH